MTTPGQDEKLRDLERTFRQTGSPDDEAAWLLERVRVGDLTQERLELAAYCGHEGARRAVGEEECVALAAYLGGFGAVRVADGEFATVDVADWVRGLSRWGPKVMARAWTAAATTSLPEFERQFPGDDQPRSALVVVSTWLSRTSPPSEVEVFRVLGNQEMLSPHEVGPRAHNPAYRMTWTLVVAAVCRTSDKDAVAATWRRVVTDCSTSESRTRAIQSAIALDLRTWAMNGA